MTERPVPFGSPELPVSDPDTVRVAVAAIAARDPLFNLDAFLAQAHQAFWLVGRAHAQCRAELCAGVLAPTMFERERAVIEHECQHGAGISPHDADADSGQLVSITSDTGRDTIVVHFVSRWQAPGPRAKPEHRAQNWCFQRPTGTQTVPVAGEGQRCRNCGSRLSGNVGGACRYCGTAVGAGDGWRVIRIDGVHEQETSSALAAMQSVVATMAAANRPGPTPPPRPPPPPPRPTLATWGRGFLRSLAVTVLVIAVGSFYAVESSGSLHRSVASVFPFIRHPRLQGPLALSGNIVAPQLLATQVPPRFQLGGTCAMAAARTVWDFRTKLPDGSTIDVDIGLPPGTGAPGVYKNSQLTVSATTENASESESWSATTASTTVLTVQADGGGNLEFTNLLMVDLATSPLSGHLTWACDLA